jgi:hypothetical protein
MWRERDLGTYLQVEHNLASSRNSLVAQGVYLRCGDGHVQSEAHPQTMYTRGLNGQAGYGEATSGLCLLWRFPGTCRRYGAHRIVQLLYQYRV